MLKIIEKYINIYLKIYSITTRSLPRDRTMLKD